MFFSFLRSAMHRLALLALGVALVPVVLSTTAIAASPVVNPLVSDWQFLSSDLTPPSQAACNAVGRRCFNPTAMHNSYNYASLLAAGNQGQGKTIALVDSFGSDTIRNDLSVFDTAFSLPHMCGETPAVACTPGTPHFNILEVQGSPAPVPPPPNNGTGQENHNLWALEVSLDVEWAHATAPLANILLVTTPTAETLGVQGFQQFMNAEQFVVDNHLADVISQSFGAGEASFHNGFAALDNLRHAFIDAQANKVTVFASSGDGGSSNIYKEPVKNPAVIPYPSVGWPASDPLVTSVGGTYLCMPGKPGRPRGRLDCLRRWLQHSLPKAYFPEHIATWQQLRRQFDRRSRAEYEHEGRPRYRLPGQFPHGRAGLHVVRGYDDFRHGLRRGQSL